MSLTTLASSAPQYRLPIETGRLIPLVFGLQVGTGGAATLDYVRIRGTKGYAFPTTDLDREVRAPQRAAVSPVESLAHIRAVLRANVTDLATAQTYAQRLFGFGFCDASANLLPQGQVLSGPNDPTQPPTVGAGSCH